MKKRGILKITLRSDLCMSSGYTWAGAVDSDICYDEYGLPYLPARRLKGSMKKAAESSLYSILSPGVLEKMFGRPGAGGVEGITMDSARLEGYEKIREAFEELRRTDRFLNKYLEKEKVLECFTRVLGQTKLEDGTASDRSLRYIRVLNAKSPLDRKPLVFLAEVSFEDEDGTVEKGLSMAARATRNLGLRRNRGLGSVTCELIGVKEESEGPVRNAEAGDAMAVISYTVRNTAPLLLCAGANDISENYISGQSVLGRLAANYLSLPGKSAEDEIFRELFLQGKAIFTNLMPVQSGQVYYPAPFYLKRLKRTKKLVNTLLPYERESMDRAFSQEEGNQAQKLKGKFAHIGEQTAVHEVSKCVVYHYSRTQKTREGQEGLLYSLEAVKENQRFSGKICFPQKYAGLMEQLLTQKELRFGKSKGAEYGKCILESLDITEAKEERFPVSKGELFAVILLSDSVFFSENDYTINYDEIYKKIAEELQISKEKDVKKSMMRTKELFGYQTKWNLRKAPVPAVAAGSVFVYKAAENMTIQNRFIGEKNGEGCGQIRLERLADMAYIVEEKQEQKAAEEMNAATAAVLQPLIGLVAEKLALSSLKKQALEERKLNVSASTLGRAVLMLQESLDENREDGYGALCSFAKRISSIKRGEERRQLMELPKLVAEEKEEGDGKEWRFKEWKNVINDREVQVYFQTAGFSDEFCEKMLEKIWGEYLMIVLKNQEYRKKAEKETEG